MIDMIGSFPFVEDGTVDREKYQVFIIHQAISVANPSRSKSA